MHNHEAFPGSTTCAAIIVAAGSGSRMGEKPLPPKQFRDLGGRKVLLWSIEALLRCNKMRDIIVVVSADHLPATQELITAQRYPGAASLSVAVGGAQRTDSVRNGLAEITRIAKGLRREPLPGKVLIHDAARPGLSLAVIDELIAALDTADAACPALPVADALKNTSDGIRSVSRENLVQVQTP